MDAVQGRCIPQIRGPLHLRGEFALFQEPALNATLRRQLRLALKQHPHITARLGGYEKSRREAAFEFKDRYFGGPYLGIFEVRRHECNGDHCRWIFEAAGLFRHAASLVLIVGFQASI
jgi:hypothetical protein